LSGLTLETSTALGSSLSRHHKYSRRHASNIPAVLLPSTLTVLLLVVYTTVIATLAGTHISPVGGLGCALRERWQSLFKGKQGDRIRAIQDGLACCGFHGVKDMPFPFPAASRGVGVDECTKLWPERANTSCEEPWRGHERLIAGCVLGVAIGTFCWMAIIIAIPAIHPTWARESLRLPPLLEEGSGEGHDAEQQQQEQRIIDYEPYRDDPGETEQDRQDRLREISNLNQDSKFALQVERSRDHPSRMMRQAGRNEWADTESS